MSRTLILIAFILGLLASECFAQQKVFQSYQSKTILPIMFRGCEGVQSQGSCTLIERSLVLTAGHVVGGTIAEVKAAGETIRGKVIALDLYHDRALVRLEKEVDAAPRKFRQSALKENEPIFAIGYGRGFGYTLGRYTATKLLGKSTPGDSGGAIVDSQGELIGIVQGFASDGQLYGHGCKGVYGWYLKHRGDDPIELGNEEE
jgi:S1-C subfamily serine protease